MAHILEVVTSQLSYLLSDTGSSTTSLREDNSALCAWVCLSGEEINCDQPSQLGYESWHSEVDYRQVVTSDFTGGDVGGSVL